MRTQKHAARPEPGEAQPPHVAERVVETAKRANRAVKRVADTSGVTRFVEKNPYQAAAAALAVGYIAGGGLFTRTTVKLFQFGAQLTQVPVVRNTLLEYAEKVVDGFLGQARRFTHE